MSATRHRLYVIQSTDGKWFWDIKSRRKSWSYSNSLDLAWVGSHWLPAERELRKASDWCKSKTWRIREFRMAPIKKGKVKRAKRSS